MSTKSILVQGGDGTAIPRGCVGESYTNEFTIAAGATTFSYTLATPIPTGTWLIQYLADFAAGGSVGAFAMHSVSGFGGEVWMKLTDSTRVQSVSEMVVLNKTSPITTFSGTCVNTTSSVAYISYTAVRIA